MKRPGDAGFTLIELMIVAVIITILATIAVPAYQSGLKAARMRKALEEMRIIMSDIDTYRLENQGELPLTLADIGHSTRRDPWGNPYQYLNFETGTGSAAQGNGNGNGNGKGNGKTGPANLGAKRKDRNLVPINSDYDFYSMGPDGRSVPPLTAADSRDDIVRANDGQFLGRAADY